MPLDLVHGWAAVYLNCGLLVPLTHGGEQGLAEDTGSLWSNCFPQHHPGKCRIC